MAFANQYPQFPSKTPLKIFKMINCSILSSLLYYGHSLVKTLLWTKALSQI